MRRHAPASAAAAAAVALCCALGRADQPDGPDEPLPPGAIGRLGTSRFRHGGGRTAMNVYICAVGFRDDGKQIISVCNRGMGVVWDAATGRRLRSFQAAPTHWRGVALTADGSLACIYNYQDRHIHVWQTADGREVRKIRTSEPASAVFPAGTANVVTMEGRSSLVLYDAAAGKQLRRITDVCGKNEYWLAAAGSPDGTLLVSVTRSQDNRRRVQVWDARSGQRVWEPKGVANDASAVSFSPDGKGLLVGEAATLRCFDVAKKAQVRSWPNTGGFPSRIEWFPDGKAVAVSAGPNAFASIGQNISIWFVEAGKPRRAIPSAGPMVGAMAASPDGKMLICGGAYGELRRYDVASGASLDDAGHYGPVESLAVTPDGKTIATASPDKTVRLWSVPDARQLHVLETEATYWARACFSPDGKHLLTGGRGAGLRVWNPATGKQEHLLGAIQHVQLEMFPWPGRDAIAVFYPGMLMAVAPGTGKETDQTMLPGRSIGIAISPDGRVAATGDVQGSLFLSSASTGDPISRLDLGGAVVPQGFSPDGLLLACQVRGKTTDKGLRYGPGDSRLNVLEATSGRTAFTLTGRAGRSDANGRILDPGAGIACSRFSPDGRTIAVGTEDGVLRLWNVPQGREVLRRTGHHGAILEVAFLPHGKTVATASSDSTVLLWDVAEAVASRPPAKKLDGRELERLWSKLAEPDAAAAYAAITALAGGGIEARAFLAGRLAALEPDRPAPQAERIQHLIRELGDDKFRVRQKATDELAKLGERARPALRRALEGKLSEEAATRVRGLLEAMKPAGPIIEPKLLQRMRAVLALRYLDPAAAVTALQTLAERAPDARLAKQAQAVLASLKGAGS